MATTDEENNQDVLLTEDGVADTVVESLDEGKQDVLLTEDVVTDTVEALAEAATGKDGNDDVATSPEEQIQDDIIAKNEEDKDNDDDTDEHVATSSDDQADVIVQDEAGWYPWMIQHWYYFFCGFIGVFLVLPFVLPRRFLGTYMYISFGVKFVLYTALFYMRLYELLELYFDTHTKVLIIMSVFAIFILMNVF